MVEVKRRRTVPSELLSRRDALQAAATVPFIPQPTPTRAPQRSGIPPWHMWGNTQTITTTQTGGSGVGSNPGAGQLVRINYRRPETWHWVFSSQLIEAPTPGLPGSDARVQVFYDLTVGIGRAMIVIPAFETHEWFWNNPNTPPIDTLLTTNRVVLKRSTSVTGGGPTIVNVTDVVDEIVAQDLQLQCRVVLTTTGNGFTAKVAASAQFSPKTHIRPEWSEKRYPGGEES